MKLVQNGENTLRVSLTSEDLTSYRVSAEELDYDMPEGKRLLSEIFDRAKEEIGFDATARKVYIQLYPKKDGGCEIFVIKMEEEKRDCFAFDSLESFLCAKDLFSPEDKPFCYRWKKGDHFLILASPHTVPPALCEFGEKWRSAPSRSLLRARYKRIRP